MNRVRSCLSRHRTPQPDECGLCYRALYDERYSYLRAPGDPAVHGGSKFNPGISLAKQRSPCRHLGAETGERRLCPTCSGHVEKKVFACAKHTTCVLTDCPSCADRAPSPIAVRHLLFHVMPIRGNGVWQRNLDQLLQRFHVFNGVRVIAVVRDHSCDPPEAVQEYVRAVAGDTVQWVVIDNVAHLREVATWGSLWEKVATLEPGHATFYGHAKGVTRPVNPGVTCHPWAHMLYEVNLDYLPLVELALQAHALAGSFKKIGAGFQGSSSSWHYSGTFFWARNRDVFTRDWKRIDQAWWGTEAWPGVHFRPEEAACLFHEGTVPRLNMYSMGYLRDVVEPEYEKWKSENRQGLSVTG